MHLARNKQTHAGINIPGNYSKESPSFCRCSPTSDVLRQTTAVGWQLGDVGFGDRDSPFVHLLPVRRATSSVDRARKRERIYLERPKALSLDLPWVWRLRPPKRALLQGTGVSHCYCRKTSGVEDAPRSTIATNGPIAVCEFRYFCRIPGRSHPETSCRQQQPPSSPPRRTNGSAS